MLGIERDTVFHARPSTLMVASVMYLAPPNQGLARVVVESVRECRRPVAPGEREVPTVEDETGAAALGSCEYDLAVPGHALIYINMDEIEDRSYLGRSTVLHELGHAIFDAPAWVLANRQGRLDLGDDSRGGRAFRLVTPGPEHLGNSRTADGPMDWAEFRANEVHGRVPGAADGTAPGAPSPVPALRSAADRRSIPDRPGADQGRLHRPARLQARDGGLRARRGLRAVARLHRGAAQVYSALWRGAARA